MSAMVAVGAASRTSRVAQNLTNSALSNSGYRPVVFKRTILKNEKTGGGDTHPKYGICRAQLTSSSEWYSAVSVYAGKEFAGLIGLTHASSLERIDGLSVSHMGRSAA